MDTGILEFSSYSRGGMIYTKEMLLSLEPAARRRPSALAHPAAAGSEALMAYAAFFIVALIATGSALGLILRTNAIHGALFLVINLGSIAALYLMLGAEFLAAAQVIVYAGAIMVLFVFAIMVLIPGKEETGPDPRRAARLLALPVGALLFLLLVFVIVGRLRGAPTVGGPSGSVAGGRPAALHDLPVPLRADVGAPAGGHGRRAPARPAPRVSRPAGGMPVVLGPWPMMDRDGA